MGLLIIFIILSAGFSTTYVVLNKLEKKTHEYPYGWGEIDWPMFCAIPCICLMVILLTCTVFEHGLAERNHAVNQVTYESLIYKAEHGNIKDEFGLTNKSYIDEVQAWNEKITKYKSLMNGKWVGCLFPEKEIEGLDVIDLDTIMVKGEQNGM